MSRRVEALGADPDRPATAELQPTPCPRSPNRLHAFHGMPSCLYCGMAPSAAPPLPPFGGAEWCGWADPHPPHLYAAHGGVEDDVMLYACSGEGDE